MEVARNEIELIHEKFVEFHKNGKLDSNIFTDSLWVELNMFIKNPESYVKYMNFLKALKSDDLENMIKKLINKKNIVLFGRGNMGGIAYYVLIKEGINSIIAWCDNNEKYQGTEYMGKKVYSLEDVIKKYDKEDLIFVITSVDYKHEIRNQLIKNKINPENVFCYNGEGYFGI